MTVTLEEINENRFYTIESKRYVSVTTGIGDFDTNGLKGWAGWMAAKEAFANLPRIVASLLVRPCERTNFKHGHDFGMPCSSQCPCGRCTPCLRRKFADSHVTESSRRSDEGKKFHKWVETYILSEGRTRLTVPPAVQVYVDQFEQFVKDYGLTHESFLFAEAIGVNHEHEYAGTIDGAVLLRAVDSDLAAYIVAACHRVTVATAIAENMTAVVLVDYKTKEKDDGKVKFYPTQSAQITAYRRCPQIMMKGTDVFTEMPETHGGVVVQLRPESYTARLVSTADREFEAFLNMKNAFMWRYEYGANAVSGSRNPELKPVPAKPVRKRTPAKKTTTVSAPILEGEPAPAARKAAVPRQRAAKATKAAPAGANLTMTSLQKPAPVFAGHPAAHPDSPYGDEIPF